MAERVFTKDTMLDLVVNIIPLGILAFFMGLFVVWGPYSWDPLYSTLMLGIIGVAFLLLAVLTYVSAVAIEGDAMKNEGTGRTGYEHEDGDDEPVEAVADGAPSPGSDGVADPADEQ